MKVIWVDSYSDGMCGWVKLMDADTRDTVKVPWSVDHPEINSQSQAVDKAKKLLAEKL